jgi:hypothetical protein
MDFKAKIIAALRDGDTLLNRTIADLRTIVQASWTEMTTALGELERDGHVVFDLVSSTYSATDKGVKAAAAAPDAPAAARGYADGVTCASYVSSTLPGWAAEAEAFVAWRDSVWLYALTLLGEVKSGARQPPSLPEFLQGMPPITWPSNP